MKYYIYILEENDIIGASGLIEYPKIRQTTEVVLTDMDRAYFKKLVQEIISLIETDQCPAVINKSYCKKCSYYEFCYVHE